MILCHATLCYVMLCDVCMHACMHACMHVGMYILSSCFLYENMPKNPSLVMKAPERNGPYVIALQYIYIYIYIYIYLIYIYISEPLLNPGRYIHIKTRMRRAVLPHPRYVLCRILVIPNLKLDQTDLSCTTPSTRNP